MLKKLLLGLLGLFVVYVLVVISGVLPRSTDAQNAALSVLEKPYERAYGNHNGFQDLWLAPYAIPDSEVAAAYAAELKAYQEHAAANKNGGFVSTLDKKYPKQTLPKEQLCPRGPKSCLEFVRANPEQARKTVGEFADFGKRLEKLRSADHVRNDLDFSLWTPLPPMQGMGHLQTLGAAVDFMDGKHDVALDAVCQNLSTWRRLRSRTDLIVVDMVGIAYGRDQILLLAEMLAELPTDYPLPQSCAVALGPIATGEMDQCDTARGEIKFSISYIKQARDDGYTTIEYGIPGDTLNRMVSRSINLRMAKARMAPYLATFCESHTAKPGEWNISTVDRIFDPVGSMVSDIAVPDFNEYPQRARDFAGLLQAMRTVVWLRGQADAETALASQPEHLKFDGYKPVLDKAKQTLTIEFMTKQMNDSKPQALPLAASRLAAAQPAGVGTGAVPADAANN